jgi:NAD(P)-dependent dehydrogenase (short-subunit alcohol dehydrogenase family)
MKTILVAGGAGEVGEGIVRQLLAKGHRVVVQSRSMKKINELQDLLGDPEMLVAVQGDIGDEEGVAKVRADIRAMGNGLDGVVATIGSWWSGPKLVDLDLNTYLRVMHDRLTTHFLVARTFLHEIQNHEGSSYTFIHGASGFIPIPKSGPVSIAGAAQVMMKDVFAKEMEDKPVRINLLSMMGSIATRSHPSDDPDAITADDVGSYVAYLADSEVRGQSIKFSHRREIPS